MNERKKGKKKKTDLMKQPQKPENRTSWKEIVYNGWKTQKQNTMGTNQKIFSTNEHTINLSAIPQAGTILPSLLLMIENQFFH